MTRHLTKEGFRGQTLLTTTIWVACSGIAFYLAVVPLPRILLELDGNLWHDLPAVEQYRLEASLRTALVQAVAGTLVVLSAIAALRQYSLSRSLVATQHSAQYVEAFTKAVEQISSKENVLQVAGVYALDRLAGTNDQDRERIVQVLSVFIRDGVRPNATTRAALGVLSRHRKNEERIDLSGSFLAEQNLRDLDLRSFIFDKCDLRGADLTASLVDGATFHESDCARAKMPATLFATSPTLKTKDGIRQRR